MIEHTAGKPPCEWSQIRGNLRRAGGNPELSPGSTSTAIGRGLSMAIRTQQPEVLNPIVPVIAIDVVEFQRNGLAHPRLQPTRDTAMFKHPLP